MKIMGLIRRGLSIVPRGKRGGVAVIFGISAVPMILMVGLAVDATRIWLVRTKVQQAIDAATMIAGVSSASTSQATITTNAWNMFLANMSASASGGTAKFMGITITQSNFAVTFPDAYHINVAANVTVPTSFLSIVAPTEVISTSATTLIGGGVEMALVLDVSLSMSFAMSDGTANTKEQALQSAVSNMLNTMYGGSDTLTNMYISVVPFAAAVNIGNTNTAWLNPSFTTTSCSGSCTGSGGNGNWPVTYKGSTADGSGWRGCVEARQNGMDVTEDGPSNLFSPYYWPTTYQQYPNPSQSGTYYTGDNDWTPTMITDTNSANQSIYPAVPKGPNLGCPHSTLLPLTASKTTILNKVSGLTLTNPGGTLVAQGMQWGWLTVSPQWQGGGGWNRSTSQGIAQPQAYNAPNNTKVVVLMTDGNSEQDGAEMFYGAASSGATYSPDCTHVLAPECIRSSGGTNVPKAAAWANSDADSWYTSYGRVSNGRLLASPPAYSANAAADSNSASQQAGVILDNKLLSICTNMKNQGVVVFTIYFHSPTDDQLDYVLGAGSGAQSTQSLMQSCATDSQHFFNSSSSSAINTAFLKIARTVNALRFTK